MTDALEQAVLAVLREQNAKRIWVAYSGGLDSHVLLHLCARLRTAYPGQLRALHVNHGLQAEADAWQNHCASVCAALDVPLSCQRINVAMRSGDSLEAVAREARYRAFQAELNDGDILLSAQHADDQAETLLLQLLRGSGPPGLAAMPAARRLGRGKLLRPLLAFSREELALYAQAHDLHWIDDPSNAEQRFERNFLRHALMPQLKQRWPGVLATLARAAAHQAQAAHLLSELAEIDWAACQSSDPRRLPIPCLQTLSAARRDNLLRYWLQLNDLPLPSARKLEQISRELIGAAADRQPCLQWPGGEVRRHRQDLFALAGLPPPPGAQSLLWSCAEAPPALPLGRLCVQRAAGQGLSLPRTAELEIRFGAESERFYWRGHRRALKKCLQAANIPAWLRVYAPLLYYQQQLVAIPGVGVHDAFCAAPDEVGHTLRWEW